MRAPDDVRALFCAPRAMMIYDAARGAAPASTPMSCAAAAAHDVRRDMIPTMRSRVREQRSKTFCAPATENPRRCAVKRGERAGAAGRSADVRHNYPQPDITRILRDAAR